MIKSADRSHHGERGFTLLELLVAMVILGITLTLVGSGGRLLRDTGDRLAGKRDALADLTVVTTLLQERLGDAVAVDFGRAGRTAVSFSGTRDEARFLTLGRNFEPGSPLVLMAIGKGENGGIEVLRAEIDATETSFAALDNASRTETRSLAGSVTDVEIDYFGRQDGADGAEWHTEWQEETRLPLAVRLRLQRSGRTLPPIIVPVRQTLATLCATPEPPPVCGL